MKIALIDIGTNAVRLEIYSTAGPDGPRLLHRDRRVLRLGGGLYHNNRLNLAVTEPTLAAFREFRSAVERFAPDAVRAVGTSALREAENAEDFCRQVEEAAGFQIEIISGEEEARLIARGILANETDLHGTFALIDIGGGSTEVSFCRNSDVLYAASVPLGAVRCQQTLLRHIPPEPERIEQLRALAADQFGFITEHVPDGGLAYALGSSGTARALEDLQLPQSAEFRSGLAALIEAIRGCSEAQILALPGMRESRVDIILAGAILLHELLELLNIDTLRVTRFSLRRGLLAEAMAQDR